MSSHTRSGIMVAEVYAGLSAFKAMFDMAKGLKDINDATIRNGAIIELQEQILSAQEAQSALVERIRELEKQVADFKAWETEKQRYALKQVSHFGSTVYVLKPTEQGTDPPHCICTACYQRATKGILQPTAKLELRQRIW